MRVREYIIKLENTKGRDIIYKLTGDGDIYNIFETVLKNRRIKDIDSFINYSEKDILSPYLLKNMDRAVKLLKKHMNSSKEVLVTVIVDSDTDGYTSSASLINYLKNNTKNLKIEYLMHEKKQHGLTPYMMKKLISSLPDLLIIPDASSGDFEQHKDLREKGVDIIVLDHHDVDRESEDAIVVSNHPNISPEYENRELSGVGIVLKFLEALDEELGLQESHKYHDLVAVGIVADIMSLCHPETRYYVYNGLSNIRNSFIRHLIYKNAYHALHAAYPKIVSWNISNFMNANIRVGKMEDKITMFRALLGEEEQLTRISRYRGQEREVTEELHETAYRLCSNSRGRQRTLKSKLSKEVVDFVEDRELYKNPIIIATLESFEEGFSGFIAAEIVKKYKKPTIIVSLDNDTGVYKGSLRGYDPLIENTRKFLLGLNTFNYVEGHDQAAGVAISKENIDITNQLIREELKDSKEQPTEVDFVLKQSQLKEQLIREFDSIEKYWGKGVEEPVVAVRGILVEHISFGTTMKFVVDGIEYICFSPGDDLKKLADKMIELDIIGTLGINRFRGNEIPQVMIQEYKVINIYDTTDIEFEF